MTQSHHLVKVAAQIDSKQMQQEALWTKAEFLPPFCSKESGVTAVGTLE